MMSDVVLDSAVFQLTPTRTRYELIIKANRKTEKIASGLLNPFLSHLKTAQEQISKGGYSIILEPDRTNYASWFTKGTLERFVRFVSTPEVLERARTIESEITQIDEAIAVQSSDTIKLNAIEDGHVRSSSSGGCVLSEAENEKAVVHYKPPLVTAESKGSPSQEKSKVHLLRVLGARKSILRKEQAMAFARAVAAGFDVDHMAQLIVFSESFGAERLREACLRYMDLLKPKSDAGQWRELVAAEDTLIRSDLTARPASGIPPSELTRNQEFSDGWTHMNGQLSYECSEKSINGVTVTGVHQHFSLADNAYKQPTVHQQVVHASQQCSSGQVQPPVYQQMPVQHPFFQYYPVQGIPFYQNHPGIEPLYPVPYLSPGDAISNFVQGIRHHSYGDKDGVVAADAGEGAEKCILGLEKKLHRHEVQIEISTLDEKNSHMLSMHNSSTSSKRQITSGGVSELALGSKNDQDTGGSRPTSPEEEQKSNRISNVIDIDATTFPDEGISDGANDHDHGSEREKWKAFQNCLLQEDDKSAADESILSSKEDIFPNVRKNMDNGDLELEHGPDLQVASDERVIETHNYGQEMTCDGTNKSTDERMAFHGLQSNYCLSDGKSVEIGGGTGGYKRILSDELVGCRQGNESNDQEVACCRTKESRDELMISQERFHSSCGQSGTQFTEMHGMDKTHTQFTSDDFIVFRQGNESGNAGLMSDPISGNEYNCSICLEKGSCDVTDESFIIPFRLDLCDQAGINRTAFDLDCELPTQRSADIFSNAIRKKPSYEVDHLSLVWNCGTERESIGYDVTADYEPEALSKDAKLQESGDTGDGFKVGSSGAKAAMNKVRKGALEKRKIHPTKKANPPRSNPLAEAQLRAERIRSYKAGLQKIKKEKEEEEVKRLEALKRERQKRIAARSSSASAQSQSPSEPTRSHVPPKLCSHARSSKFNDSMSITSRAHQLPERFGNTGISTSEKFSRRIKYNNKELAENVLDCSVSSLPELRRDDTGSTPESKAERARRLSEPKGSKGGQRSLSNLPRKNLGSKLNITDEPHAKMSAIRSLDRTKSEALPGLKIKAVSYNPRELKLSSSFITSGSTKLDMSNEWYGSNGDDNSIIEKTVLVLEKEKLSVTATKAAQERPGQANSSGDVGNDNAGSEIALQVASSLGSPLIMETSILNEQDEQNICYEAKRDEIEALIAHADNDKGYHAPYARISSMEDSMTISAKHDSSEAVSEVVALTDKCEVWSSDSANFFWQGYIPEDAGKLHSKETSARIRKLLKLGRKNQGASRGISFTDSEQLSTGDSNMSDSCRATFSNEVSTLKNLISQDDSPASRTAQKVLRPFSLLSPFRRKSNEKKLMG